MPGTDADGGLRRPQGLQINFLCEPNDFGSNAMAEGSDDQRGPWMKRLYPNAERTIVRATAFLICVQA